MHIADGVLSVPVLVVGSAAALAGVAVSLKRLPWENLMPTAIVSSAFFVASLVHLPVGVSSVHLLLNGLAGVILGPAALPAIAVALFLQALLFHFGGLVSLGVNIAIMGFPALVCGALFRSLLHGNRVSGMGAAFFCGALGVALSGLLAALALALSGEVFQVTATALLLGHIPVMLVEGIVTAFIFKLVYLVAPEMLNLHRAVAPVLAVGVFKARPEKPENAGRAA